MPVQTWIEKIRPDGPNLKEIVWWVPSLHSHRSGPRGPIDLDSFLGKTNFSCVQDQNYCHLKMDWQKSVTKAPILGPKWRLPSLNGHNLDPRGPIDLNFFPMARPLSGLGDGHRNCPKSLFLAKVICVQSNYTKWYFRATFYKMTSLFCFHCYYLHCQDFGSSLLNPPRFAWVL